MAILLILPFLACYCVMVLHDYRMFQLNSYKAGVYVRWLQNNFIKDYVSRRFVLTIFSGCLAGFFAGRLERRPDLYFDLWRFIHNFFDIWDFILDISDPRSLGFIFALWCITLLFHNWPQEAEKTLVHTPRVIRMFVTHSVILTLLLAWSLSMNFSHQLLFLFLIFLLTPLFVLLVNFINYPIEKAIGSPAPVPDADSREKIDKNSERPL